MNESTFYIILIHHFPMEKLFNTVANDVLITLFSEWLEISNLAVTDSATCSKTLRRTFLSLLQHPGFVHRTKYISCSKEYLSWLVHRQLRVDSLDCCDGSVVVNLLPEFVEYFRLLKYLNYFKMHGYFYSSFLPVLNASEFRIKSLDLSHSRSMTTDKFFMPILISPVHCNLTELNLTHCLDLTEQFCSVLSNYCPKLTVLTFVGCEGISVEGIIIAVKSFSTQLTRLTVIPSRSQSESYTDDKLMAIVTHCPNLTHLDVSFWSTLTLSGEDQILVELLKMSQLKHFSVTGCENLSTHELSAIFHANTSLTSVILNSVSQVNNLLLAVLVQHCHLLEIVDLTGCIDITDMGFKFIALHCPLLKELHISGCGELTDVSVLLLIEHCPLLKLFRAFVCNGLTDYSISELIDRCKHLVDLYASDLELTIGNVVRALKGSNKLVLKGGQKNLRQHLHFNRTDTCKEVIFCSSEPQNFISQWKTVALLCPDLQSIELHGFDNITVIDMVSLITPSLTSFTLHSVTIEDSENVINLFEHLGRFTKLTKLKIVDCCKIRLSPLLHFLEMCWLNVTPQLTHLHLTNVTECQKATIISLFITYKQLKVLNINGSDKDFLTFRDETWLRDYRVQGMRVTINITDEIQSDSDESGNDNDSSEGGEEDDEGDNVAMEV